MVYFFTIKRLNNVHLCLYHVMFSTIGVGKLRRFDLKIIDTTTQLKRLLLCSVRIQTHIYTGIVVVTDHICLMG